MHHTTPVATLAGGHNGAVYDNGARPFVLPDGTILVPDSYVLKAEIAAVVTITPEAWRDCVAWDNADQGRKPGAAFEDDRLRSLLSVAGHYAREYDYRAGTWFHLRVYRVPRGGTDHTTTPANVLVVISKTDDGKPRLTLQLPDES